MFVNILQQKNYNKILINASINRELIQWSSLHIKIYPKMAS
jgi:hypothetical protein